MLRPHTFGSRRPSARGEPGHTVALNWDNRYRNVGRMFPIDVLACGRVGGLEVVRGAGTRGFGRLDVEGREVQPGTIISQHHIIMTYISVM